MSESASREPETGGVVNEIVEVVKTVVYALLMLLFARGQVRNVLAP